MTSHIFTVLDGDKNLIKSHRRRDFWLYSTLGEAKAAARNYVKYKNRRLSKSEKLHFDDFRVIEYELVEKVQHKL